MKLKQGNFKPNILKYYIKILNDCNEISLVFYFAKHIEENIFPRLVFRLTVRMDA